MKTGYEILGGLVAFSALALGCQPTADSPNNETPEKTQTTSVSKVDQPEGHSHGDAPHGGTIADWGGGEYHVEFAVDHDVEQATIYILGSDAQTAAPIDAESLLLSIKEPSFQVELKPQPLEGEDDGKSSRFVGQHEKLGIVQEFAGTIGGQVDGTPYAGDFKEEPHGDHEH